MKLKSSFFYTIREDIKDEESKSGNLLVRSGMIKKAGSGIYSYMPLGLKIVRNVENIVREEMDITGAQELVMPSLLPEEVYVDSGRRDIFGSSMFSLKDRFNRNYVLGPTHEELFVATAKEKVKSYKDLPFNIYQMANKYRDEPRPRYGLIRVREFIMKDAYSFDTDLENLGISYDKMFEAYKKIFNRCGLDYKIVTADTGAMGGLLSEEFQAVTDIGEDILILCEKCDYASNIEVSECVTNEMDSNEEFKELELIHTPNVGKIEDLVNNYHIEEKDMAKTLIYKVDDKFYAFMVKSDREINETKISKLLNAKEVELAQPEDVENITQAKVGFAGPIGLSIPVIADNDIMKMKNFLVGANKLDYHYINANTKDFEIYKVADIKNAKEGDICPKCGGKLIFKKGIEVGNTFKLGTKYSEALGLNYLDQDNKLNPVWMGCYGIGIGRIIAAVAEQYADDYGIKWPMALAPYKVAIVLINDSDEEQLKVATSIHDKLVEMKIDTILDDRDLRPGVKFNDMDLIGIPIRITVGKKVNEGKVEFKLRNESESIDLDINSVIEEVLKNIQ